MLSLETPLANLPTVNKNLIKRLKKIGLSTAQDLLFYLPFRYDDFRKVVLIKDAQTGERVTLRGQLQLIGAKRSFFQHRLITEAVIADDSGQLKIVWFNQPYLTKILKAGEKISLAGRLEFGKFGLHMVNPVFEKEKEGEAGVHTGRMVPIYPTTSGVTQKQLRFLIRKVLPSAEIVKDWLPVEIVSKNNWLDLGKNLCELHFPSSDKNFDRAEERLQFEELFLVQLHNELSRREVKQLSAVAMLFKQEEIKNFVSGLPFELTGDQRKSAWEILQDLEKNHPMNRLLDGDVGSGKTVVAGMAIYNTILNGFQVVLLAPTEILANQHFLTMIKLFKQTGIRIGLLTGGNSKINTETESIGKKVFLEKVKKGEIDLIIGTHAVLEKSVKFSRLGLAIVDEQHRFGVRQRHILISEKKHKKFSPHFLSMTATPIPRSYALALYGDLDLSLIREMPKGRQIVITRLVEEFNRPKAYEFIRGEVKKGRQIFVVCPLIGEEDEEIITDDKKTVLREFKKLSEEIFPDLRITYLHGKMKSQEKEEMMKDFLEHSFDILVSTSVVEVGVDFPNATIMLIEGSERFGLAQLHQFRGRVGRGTHQSYCLLFTNSLSEKTKERLKYFAQNSDGFSLAEKDLELRGPGMLMGEIQHGFDFWHAGQFKNLGLIKKSREAAQGILEQDGKLAGHPLLKEKIKDWGKLVHLE